ncbi:MAG: hypothetical protein GZ094_21470 [Mariniphaga sp.]|nr:hypothetical protein [Mariniphaga sp.]
MQQSYITELLRKPAWMLFLCSWLFYLIGLFLFSQLVWDSNTYMPGFKGANFDEYLSNIRRIDMVRYALSPLYIIGISAVVWILIKSGLIISRIEFDNKLLFKIVFLGLIFISLPFWVKTIWLILFSGNYTPDDVKFFFPGSIVPFLDISDMRETMINTLAHINLYHLSFMLFIAWQLSANSGLRFFNSLLLVGSTYGLGIVLLRCIILVILM